MLLWIFNPSTPQPSPHPTYTPLSKKQINLYHKICELKDKDSTAIIRDCSMI